MTPDRSSEQDEAPPVQAILPTPEEFGQLPFIAFTGWWNMMLAPWLPDSPHHPHFDADEQLVVPEPIEETGEHALFA